MDIKLDKSDIKVSLFFRNSRAGVNGLSMVLS